MGQVDGVLSSIVTGSGQGHRQARRRSKTTIPLVGLRAQYASIKTEINVAVQYVMADAGSVQGKEVACFEWEFANYCGASTAVGVSSGTEALQLALLACGVGRNDEVVTTPLAHHDIADAVCGIGAVPVFVDIDPLTCTMNAGEIEAVLTDRTKVILPVHLYGRPADMGRIMAIAQRYGLKVVESAGHAHGARYLNRHVGTIGHIGCFSCRPGENLGAYGEAGVLVTRDPYTGALLRRLRDQGERRKYGWMRPRPGSRLDPLQAAVLRVKLRHLDRWNGLRQGIAGVYRDELSGAPLKLPTGNGMMTHAYGMFVVRSQHREWIREGLRARGIASAVHYPVPLHLMPACHYLNYAPGDFPETERAAQEVLSLPMYPELEHSQASCVAEEVKALLAAVR